MEKDTKIELQKIIETKEVPDNLCLVPWNSIYLSPRNAIYPCCIALKHKPLGDVDDHNNDLQSMVNTEGFKELRRQFLRNEKPAMCNDCYIREDKGQTSARMNWNKLLSRFPELKEEQFSNTEPDGYVNDFKLRHLEYRDSNICNYKCRFCNPMSSNTWYKEWHAMGKDVEFAERFNPKTGVSKANVDWSKIDLSYLKAIHMAGGEPTVMEETYAMLKYLKELGSDKNIDISIVSNTSKLAFKGESILDLLSDFKYVTWSVSCDGLGPVHNYLRAGGLDDWDIVEENIQTILDWCKQGKIDSRHIKFHTTVNWNNAFAYYDVFKKYNTVSEDDVIQARTFFSTGPDGTGLNHLPNAQLQRIIDFYKSTPHAEHQWIKQIITFCERSFGDEEQEEKKWQKLQNYRWETDWLDKSRNQSFTDTFPEWADFYNSIPVIDKLIPNGDKWW